MGGVAAFTAECLPVSLLTGFLGSGKSTVLNHLLRQSGMARCAVVINEFGEVGIDHLLVRPIDESVVQLNSGCLCCTIRGDLIETLRDLFLKRVKGEVPRFDRVVIETTGLADPAPILHTLMTDPLISARYRLDGVITTVDATTAVDTFSRQPESVKQIAVADRLLITKRDLVSDQGLASVQDRLTTLNPAAPQILADHGVVEAARIFNAGLYDPDSKSLDVRRWLKEEAYRVVDGADHDHAATGHDAHDHGQQAHQQGHKHDVNRHDDQIRAFCVRFEEPIDPRLFELWTETLAVFAGPDLLRVKGIVALAGMEQPIAVHGVQHVFHPPAPLPDWPTADRATRLVFITRNVDAVKLRQSLDVLRDALPAPMPNDHDPMERGVM